jgi:hypothetical protein
MSNDSRKTVAELLAPMLKKTLFAAISRVAAPASEIEPFVAGHLAYMYALEAEGRQAREEEPLIKRGLRTFELRKWELREGRIDISLRASVSRFSL